ncbi:MAG: hypothetical protein HN794_03990 [Euryarchaeota archaeon]|nr:hypothetical protein [Euryarchaeota archaeon]MBT4924994.1 hypothetical protein [Euryarchaeota archaeon]MBT5735878.1 hypothetical protein [Euryarchaeota archaeon]MBT7460184.1 hypothetical protein [Euryarchaeota archaeon]
MSEQVELTNPVDLSVGGVYGHIFRRVFHISMFIIPVIFFEFGESFSDSIGYSLAEVVSIVILVAIFGEAIRLKFEFTIFGQREYEAKQVSALAWGGLAIGMVLLLAPIKQYAYPLIFSLSFGDPFMGEIRRMGVETREVIIYSILFVSAIWLVCWYLFATPLWLALIFAPLCVFAEMPRLRYIDDNATMLLIPLVGILILEPFIGLL